MITRGAFECGTTLLDGVDCTLDVCHDLFLLTSMTQQAFDELEVRGVDRLVHSQVVGVAAGLVLRQVALVGLLVHELVAPCCPEALLRTGVRPALRHPSLLLGLVAQGTRRFLHWRVSVNGLVGPDILPRLQSIRTHCTFGFAYLA